MTKGARVIVSAALCDKCTGSGDPVLTVLEIPELAVPEGDEAARGPFAEGRQPTRLGRVRQTFAEIPQEEGLVTVQNGDPGLASLRIVVNTQDRGLTRLRDDDQTTIDVSGSMVPGDNTITLIGYGKPGATASVMISNIGAAASREASITSVAQQASHSRFLLKAWRQRTDLNFVWGNRIE